MSAKQPMSIEDAFAKQDQLARIRKREVTEKCSECGEWFTLTRIWQKFCSTPCRVAAYNKVKEVESTRIIEELRKKLAKFEGRDE